MNLFSADLFRQIGIGFLAGAVMVGAAHFVSADHPIESPAKAAVPLQAPAGSGDFVIESVENIR